MDRSPRRSLLLGAAVFLGLLAIVAVAIPGIGYARVATSDQRVRIETASQRVALPADETWGVYIDDANNSGYSYSRCTARDRDGRQIRFKDPWFSMSSSDTETLDFVFDTGSGDLVVDCLIASEVVTLKPMPNFKALVIGVLIGLLLGTAALVTLLQWHLRRPRPPLAVPVWPHWPPAS